MADLIPTQDDDKAPIVNMPSPELRAAVPQAQPVMPSGPAPAGAMPISAHQPLAGVPVQNREMDQSGRPKKLIPGDQVYNPQSTKWQETPYTTAQKMNPFVGMFAHASNIHNPILRTIAKVASGVGAAEDAIAGSMAPESMEERRKQMNQPAEDAERQALIGEHKASTAKSEAETEAIKNPKPKLLPGEENIREDEQGSRERAYENADGSISWKPETKPLPQAAPLPNAPITGSAPPPVAAGGASATPPTSNPLVGGAGAVSPTYTYGKKPTAKEGESPASPSQLADISTRIQGNPYIPKPMAAGLGSFPPGYRPTVNDVKERLANIKEIEDASRAGKQDEFNDKIKDILAQNTLLNSRFINEEREQRIEAAKDAKENEGDYTKTGEEFIKTLPGSEQAYIRGVGEGRIELTASAQRSKAGALAAREVAAAYPGWDSSRAEAYFKARTSFTSGEDSKVIEHLNTGIQHMGKLYDVSTFSSNFPGVALASRTVGAALSSTNTNAETFKVERQRVLNELDHAYDSKSLTDSDKQEIREGAAGIDHWTPNGNRADMRALVSLLESKLNAVKSKWDNAKPSPAVPDFPVISQESASVINRMAAPEHSKTISPVKAITPEKSRQTLPNVNLSPAAQALVDRYKDK